MPDDTQVHLREIRAFKRIFGEEGMRNHDQQIVLGALMRESHFHGPVFVAQKQFGTVTDEKGRSKIVPLAQSYDPIAAALTDGMRRIVTMILERSDAKSPEVPQSKHSNE